MSDKSQLYLEVDIEPTSEDICWMCHFSSGCVKCCSKCSKKDCNGSEQACGQGMGFQAPRFRAIQLILARPGVGYKNPSI